MSESFERKNVLLGVTGSIAAYKALELSRLLVKRGYKVRVIMTKSACEFIQPMSFQAVTGESVVQSFWEEDPNAKIGHIELADWADVVCVAPATANTISKLATGMADETLYGAILASKAPVLIAPAMNVNMLSHPAVQDNLSLLMQRGVSVVEPGEGELACGWNGSGRLAEPQEIFWEIQRALADKDFRGKHIVIAAGPTREPIDPVRFLSNRSSGKMGKALAIEAFRRGADVTFVQGPVSLELPNQIDVAPVMTALQMRDELHRICFGEASKEKPVDLVVMTAAIADFRPRNVADSKIKKNGDVPKLELERNPDVLAELSKERGEGHAPTLIGFAVETGEIETLLDEANRKLSSKGADMIVGNFAEDAFDLDTNRVWMLDRNGKRVEVSTSFKSRVAKEILSHVSKLM